jgi:hypothetical protein
MTLGSYYVQKTFGATAQGATATTGHMDDQVN